MKPKRTILITCSGCGRRKKPENLLSKAVVYREFSGHRPKQIKQATVKSGICKICVAKDMEEEGIE